MRGITVVKTLILLAMPGMMIIFLFAINPDHWLLSPADGSMSDDTTAALLSHSTYPRILCWVLVGPKDHDWRAKAVKRTWGSRCDKLIFMSTKADAELGAVALKDVKEGRNWLWAKTRGALKYVWENHREDADWFLKADADTYVVMENLRYLLKDYNSSQALYFGCRARFHYSLRQIVNFGGAGYVLSKGALGRFVQEALPNTTRCKQSHEGDEDYNLSVCLSNIGIETSKTLDELGRHRFLHSHLEELFMGKRRSKFWSMPRVDKELPGYDCCSDGAISFHAIHPDYFNLIEFLIYRLRLREGDGPLTSTT